MPGVSDDKLFSLLKELAVTDEVKLKELFDKCRADKTAFAEALVAKDLITDDNLGKLLAGELNVPFVSLAKTAIPREILTIVPEITARAQHILAFKRDGKGLHLAMADPTRTEIRDFVAKKTGDPVRVYLATLRDLNRAFSLYNKDLQKSFEDLFREKLEIITNGVKNEAPIIELVDLLIAHAADNRASDIHIEPEKEDSLVRFRIDGVLHDVLRLPLSLHEQVISRIKVASKLKTDEHLSAQDGKIQLALPGEELDVRVSIVPITKGEKAVLRLLSSKFRQFGLADLGIGQADLNKINDAFKKPHGMILSTGPTGSGKTTTIYAILKILNTSDVNIATIEDPVEYDMPGVNQIQVNPKTNLTFADGLRSILRQDPNVIFVGEIRDSETAGIAVNAATTGHLVLSTLHTNDAATTLPRLMDMNVEPFLIASTVNIIIGQRLIRQICEKCRVSVTQTAVELARHLAPDLIKKYFGNKTDFRTYQGKGCAVCQQTGYAGRVGIFEVLVVSPAIKELITAKADADLITKKAKEEGMTTMLEDGLEKVAGGITTVEEVLRASKE